MNLQVIIKHLTFVKTYLPTNPYIRILNSPKRLEASSAFILLDWHKKLIKPCLICVAVFLVEVFSSFYPKRGRYKLCIDSFLSQTLKTPAIRPTIHFRRLTSTYSTPENVAVNSSDTSKRRDFNNELQNMQHSTEQKSSTSFTFRSINTTLYIMLT